jgi:hypothetical protein
MAHGNLGLYEADQSQQCSRVEFVYKIVELSTCLGSDTGTSSTSDENSTNKKGKAPARRVAGAKVANRAHWGSPIQAKRSAGVNERKTPSYEGIAFCDTQCRGGPGGKLGPTTGACAPGSHRRWGPLNAPRPGDLGTCRG